MSKNAEQMVRDYNRDTKPKDQFVTAMGAVALVARKQAGLTAQHEYELHELLGSPCLSDIREARDYVSNIEGEITCQGFIEFLGRSDNRFLNLFDDLVSILEPLFIVSMKLVDDKTPNKEEIEKAQRGLRQRPLISRERLIKLLMREIDSDREVDRRANKDRLPTLQFIERHYE